MEASDLVRSVKPRWGHGIRDMHKIKDILRRLDSFETILNENNPNYSDLDRIMIWRVVQFIKHGYDQGELKNE